MNDKKTERWLCTLGIGTAIVAFAGQLSIYMASTGAIAGLIWFLWRYVVVPCIPELIPLSFWATWAFLVIIHLLTYVCTRK